MESGEWESNAPVENVFQQVIYVMVTMTVETGLMNKIAVGPAGDSFFLPF